MKGKLYIKTHGCQMNEYDSTKTAELLGESHGLTLVATPEEADVLLLNTCSVREKAQEKVFSQLGMWREIKLKRPEDVVGRSGQRRGGGGGGGWAGSGGYFRDRCCFG